MHPFDSSHLDSKALSQLTMAELSQLETCHTEPIHIPGYIQPHGILFTLHESDFTILQVSDNVGQFFSLSVEELIGQPLQQLFPPNQVEQLTLHIQSDSTGTYHLIELIPYLAVVLKSRQVALAKGFQGALHRYEGTLILELEPQFAIESADPIYFYHHLKEAMTGIRQVKTVAAMAQTLAQSIKAMTGFDRVMVYRFEADQSGTVIAEAKQSHLETYLGLRYPAIDIPVQARTLFYCNWLRVIPDVHHRPSPLVPTLHPLTQAPLDLSHASLRGVSPIHIEYLQNMGVNASMTISLIDDKQLWGLIACHHYEAKDVPYGIRMACEFLGQFASIELARQQEQDIRVYRSHAKTIQAHLRRAFTHETGFIEQVLNQNATELLRLVHAEGAAIALDNHLTLIGQTPSEEEVRALIPWLLQQEAETVFATDALSHVYPAAKSFTEQASGMLAISILLHHLQNKSYHILWFRPEQIQTVNWAGKVSDAVTLNEAGTLRLCPRKSFDLWKETVREKSLPWQEAEIEAALEMRNTLMLAVLEFSQTALEQTAERAAIANRAKSQFLAKMSHELRTPLNAILGFTQLMVRDHSLSAEFQEHLDIISRSGEHLLALINDVLEMSKIEAGQLTLSETHFDLHRLLYSIKDMFILKATGKGLKLEVERSPDVPQYVRGDEGKLRQILINLLGNAVKFTSTGQVILRVKIWWPWVEEIRETQKIEESENGGEAQQPASRLFVLEMAVEDSGPGIACQDFESIFEVFMQTERGRQAQGTGLGLPISRQFARLMGGDVTVQSTLGRGSTFTCQLQLAMTTVVDVIAATSHACVIGLEPEQLAYRILIAEDHTDNRQLLVKLLETVGFEVRAAENGGEAIALYEEWHPHLIWMDIEMPIMDGYEATRRIRQAESLHSNVKLEQGSPPYHPYTKIIALTANAFDSNQDACFQAGCDDFMVKPFTETILFEKLASHLGVNYLYAEEPQGSINQTLFPSLPLIAQNLQGMPVEWIAQLHEAALDLDDRRLHDLIATMPSSNPLLAEMLRNLVDNFQFEILIDLTGSGV